VSEPAEPLVASDESVEPPLMLSGGASVAASVAASAPPPIFEPPPAPVAVPMAAPMPAPVAAARQPAARVNSAASGQVVSGRGVTGRGVIVLTLFGTAIVGLLGVAISGHRGPPFAITFVTTCAIGALLVRRRDIRTAMVAPPLLYCVLIVLISAFDTHGETGGFVSREGLYLGNAFVTGAPTLWAGTAAAVGIGWYRRKASAPRRSHP
jgi:hypothetical protein